MAYPWTRLWRALERPLRTDADGFLEVTEGAESPVALDALDAPCAVLLGESGAGKSMAMRGEVDRLRKADAEVESFDLSGRRDESQLRSDLRTALGVRGDQPIHLFFDSLDETLPELVRFDALLAEELERGYRALPRVRLRVACRTGALPLRLVESLERVWGVGKATLWEIAPLAKTDAIDAMTARGVPAPVETLARWCEAKLGPLATRPVTLGLLIDVGSVPGEAPDAMGVTDLYDRALGYMLRRVDAHSHRAALRRLAAVTLLGEKSLLRPHDRGSFLDAWTFDDLAGGEDARDGGGVAVIDRALLAAVCEGHLFRVASDASDGIRLTWQHRSFAEFLCAEWLVKRYPGEAALRWVERMVAGERRVVPQLEGVAVWLANRDEAVLDALIVDAPHLLPTLDTSRLSAVQRERAVDAFLRHADEGASAAWWRLRGTDLAAFEHPGFDAQLRLWITDTTRREAARMLCLWTAEQGRRTGLVPVLFQVALDTGDRTAVRKEAVAAIVALLPARDARLKELLPLLAEHPPEDAGQDIKGNVLRACWPWCFENVREAFAVLEAPRDGTVYGVHGWFLDRDLLRLLPSAWLPEALAWTRDRLSRLASLGHGDVRTEVLRHAWDRIDEPAVLDGLVALCVAAFHEHDDLSLPEALRTEERTAIRITLAVRILRASAASELRRLIDISVRNWLIAQDFDGLIDRAVAEEDLNLSERLLEFALHLHEAADRPADQTVRLWELAATDRFQWLFERLWKAREIDAPDVQRMRRKPRPAAPERPARNIVTEMQRCRILAELDRAEQEDPERWWQLHAWTCARPVSEEACELTLDFRLEDTPFWKSADFVVKERLFAAALHYVDQCDPHVEEWFGKRLWHRPALAGRAALILLQQYAPDHLEHLSAARWAVWTPALLDPNWMSDDQHGGVWPSIVREAYRHAPDVVRQCVLSLVDIENERGEYAFVLHTLAAIDDPPLAAALLARLRRGGVKPNIFRDALNVIGRSSPGDATDFCAEFVAAHWLAGGLDANCAAFAAGWLLRERPDTAWETLESPFHALPKLGGEAIESLAWRKAFQWFPALTAPAHLAGYYRWAKRYLQALDPAIREHFHELHMVAAPHHVHYSVAPTVVRLRDLGTEEAVAALEVLHREEPGDESLRDAWFRAQQVAAERAWRPWSLDALLWGGLPRDLLRRIREELTARYQTAAWATLLSRDAILPVERVDWQGSVEVVWERVIETAVACRRLEALLTRCCEDYPALTPLLAELRAARSP